MARLTLDGFLGEQKRELSDFGRDTRFIIAASLIFRAMGIPPTTWQHEERSHSECSTQKPMRFEFFGGPFPHAVPLWIADHGIMLLQLPDILSLQEM